MVEWATSAGAITVGTRDRHGASRLPLGLALALFFVGCGDDGGGDGDTATAASGTTGASDTSATGPTSTATTSSSSSTSAVSASASGTTTSSTTGEDTTADTGGDPGGVPPSGCPGRLAPVDPIGLVVTVGDGPPGSCTEAALHAAADQLGAADGGGTLLFECGGEHTITLTTSLFLKGDILLDGGGLITLSGGGSVRVIELDHYTDLTIQRITIRDGFVPAGSDDESGAGLLHPWFGTLRAIDVAFLDNRSESLDHDVGGGAIYAGGLTDAVLSGCTFIGNSGSTGGGVLSRSTNLRVVDTVFAGNAATSYAESGQYGNGGGLYIDRMWLDAPIDFEICGARFTGNHAKVHGSAFFSYNLEGTQATFDRCTFEANDMEGSPGGGTGTVYHEGVPLRLLASTFADNTTGLHAGGIFLGGGTDAHVENCTFVGNKTPGNAGALWAGNGAVDITNTTFAANEADYGPAIFKGQSGAVTLKNVVFAGNTTANMFSALACHETFADGGGNLQWPDIKKSGNPDTPCAAAVLFADPALLPLADNGGPTPTLALSPGSPALDIAPTCPPEDQRGLPRSGLCDAGAYELQ